MRKLIYLTLIFLVHISKGQESAGSYELGSSLMTASFLDYEHSVSGSPTFEFVNGLFFRYTKGKLGFRAHVNYSEPSSKVTYPAAYRPVPFNQYINSKDFRIGAGTQYSILKNKEWLYSYLDVSYRNIYKSGHSDGEMALRYYSTSNGFDCSLGLGFKIKLFKSVYLSPEVGCYSSTRFVKETTFFVYEYYVAPPFPYVSTYAQTFVKPVIKLPLTVKF